MNLPKLDIEKEHEIIKVIEDALGELDVGQAGQIPDTWASAKEILIYLKVRGYEVVKKDR